MSWAFNHLNHLSPLSASPVNGPNSEAERNDFDLSFPVSNTALHAQLEAWTSSVVFDYDGTDSFGTPLSAGDDARTDKDEDLFARQHYAAGGALGGAGGLYDGLGVGGSYAALLADPAMGFGATPFDSIYHQPIGPAAALPALPSYVGPSVADVVVESKKRSAGEMEAAAVTVPGVVLGGDDQANAIAIEEDKRKRNTAASARFRVKKKQREAALESSAKELRDRVSTLEHQVEALRTENGWLRGIITEKAQKEEGEKQALVEKAKRGKSVKTEAIRP